MSAALTFKKALSERLLQRIGYCVLRGPFVGLKLPAGGTWSDYDLFSKVIGSYEKELFGFLEEIVNWEPQFIFNIGASEGYYAVGLKRLVPLAVVKAYDIDLASRRILRECARANDVEVISLDEFDFSDPFGSSEDDHQAARSLFIIDCEGCEIGICKMSDRDLRRAAFIVELHDHIVPGLTEKLVSLLRGTHEVRLLDQSTRSVEKFDELGGFSPIVGSVMLNEFRATRMKWLTAVPK